MQEETTKGWKPALKHRWLAPVLALALAASLGAYAIIYKPATATAAGMSPAAAPLAEENVSAILALDKAMETLAAHVTPAVVNVTVAARAKSNFQRFGNSDDMPEFFHRFFGDQLPQMQQRPQVEHGLGSGIIISPDGYIVTNNHVVQNATDIRVTMNDRRVLSAKLVGADPLTDLAVIKVSASNLASLPWGDSTELRPGQTVLAFGNPYGFRFTVTRGIVSGLNRANPYSDDPHKPGQFIQTDAAINPGNSGGPLIDARGEVVGINTFLISDTGSFSGMGFAIPTQVAKPAVDELIRNGKVEHAYIGVGITDVTPDNARFFHLNDTRGAAITQVEPDSPGARAGLKVGDVITGINGQNVSDAGQLQVLISEKHPGTKVNLEVMRDGKDMSVPVTLEQMSGSKTASASTEEHGKARWGLGLNNLTLELREQLQIPTEVHGAVIVNVEPGSAADNSGLSRGFVIEEVNRHSVQSVADVQRELNNIPKGQDVMLLIWNNGGSTFAVMHSPEAGSSEGGTF